MAKVALLGAGLVGTFYAQSLHAKRGRDRVEVVYSRSEQSARKFAEKHGIASWTTDLNAAITNEHVDAVVIALPNFLHLECVVAAAKAGKAVLCTKPLGRTADEALKMLHAVERAGVFHGYLEDLVYTPKTLKGLATRDRGGLGKVLWVRSRETHSGPHSDWFWSKELAGGGVIVDLGCHCIEIGRSFIGKQVRPTEVVCWADTQVHPIETEDHAIGLVRYENGAIGQFEVSWVFRGGMDLRDEVVGAEGTLWLDHWLRTGSQLFLSEKTGEYLAEKAEGASGWQFPLGDEAAALGYVDMFADMFDSLEQNRTPRETFYDGYIVNAIIDAAYKSVDSKNENPLRSLTGERAAIRPNGNLKQSMTLITCW